MKRAHSLVIEAHIFREALGKDELESQLCEFANSKNIFLSTATGKSLVGAIEERNEASSFAHVSDLKPLFFSWVYTGRIVGTNVEQDD